MRRLSASVGHCAVVSHAHLLESFLVYVVAGRIGGKSSSAVSLGDDLGHVGAEEGSVKGVLSSSAPGVVVGGLFEVGEGVAIA